MRNQLLGLLAVPVLLCLAACVIELDRSVLVLGGDLADADGDVDGDSDSDVDVDADGDTDGDVDGDVDGDSDGDAEGDAESDGESCLGPDLCNGLDDDCDSETPDGSGETWYGNPCDGDDSDACQEGTFSCALVGDAYEASCSDDTDDLYEACNGRDDDCDEEIDEGDWDGDGVPRCGADGIPPDCNDNDPNLRRCDCLILGNAGLNRVYRRSMTETEPGLFEPSLSVAWTSSEAEWTNDVALFDWDDDGDHDLAVASGWIAEGVEHSGVAPVRVLENDGGVFIERWSSPSEGEYLGVAWWDWLGSGMPGIAVSQWGGTVELYANRHPTMVFAGRAVDELSYGGRMDWTSWGTGDDDMRHYLGVPRFYEPNLLLEYDVGFRQVWAGDIEDSSSTAMAWGDWDNDGYPELAVATDSGENDLVYANVGGVLSESPVWTSSTGSAARNLSWGDWNWDGYLDLVVADREGGVTIYQNVADAVSGRTLVVAWSFEAEGTYGLALGDWDEDGDLDLAVGNSSESGESTHARIYINNSYFNDEGGWVTWWDPGWTSDESQRTYSVAWGDCNLGI